MSVFIAQLGPATGTGVEWMVGMSLLLPILVLAIILWFGSKNTV